MPFEPALGGPPAGGPNSLPKIEFSQCCNVSYQLPLPERISFGTLAAMTIQLPLP